MAGAVASGEGFGPVTVEGGHGSARNISKRKLYYDHRNPAKLDFCFPDPCQKQYKSGFSEQKR